MLPRFVAAAAAALCLVAAACGDSTGSSKTAPQSRLDTPPGDDRASWPKVLNVSAIPDVSQNTLLTTFQPFADALSQDLGVEVRFTPVTDYPATVDGLAAGRLDLVWYGGYTSVQAKRATKGTMERLVCRQEDTKFKSVFVAAPGAGIAKLEDLEGRTFSFGSESSTSGHLMPRHFLLQAGIDPSRDLGKISFSGAHDATVKAVESGAVQAGALNYLVWDKMTKESKYDAAKVAVFWTTPEYVDYCWCARGDLPAGLKARIKDWFLRKDPSNAEDKKLLDLQKATKYVEAKDEWWDGVASAAAAAGMLKD